MRLLKKLLAVLVAWLAARLIILYLKTSTLRYILGCYILRIPTFGIWQLTKVKIWIADAIADDN